MHGHRQLTRREICQKAGSVSATKRRAKRDACRAVTELLQEDSDLAQLNTSDLEQVVSHALELGRILAGLDVPAGGVNA